MLTIHITLDDYIAAHRMHHQRGTAIFLLVSTVILIAGLLLAAVGWKWAIALVGGGIGGLLGGLWDDRWGVPGKVRKLYDQFKGISEPAEISWDDEYLRGKSADGQGQRKWEDYVQLKENEQIILLYITEQLWQVMPKRFFASAAQKEEFLALARKANAIKLANKAGAQ